MWAEEGDKGGTRDKRGKGEQEGESLTDGIIQHHARPLAGGELDLPDVHDAPRLRSPRSSLCPPSRRCSHLQAKRRVDVEWDDFWEIKGEEGQIRAN